MSSTLDEFFYPELFIGIAGPIGVDVDQITDVISLQLKSLNYSSELIKLTSAMLQFGSEESSFDNKFDEYMGKMTYANELRKFYKKSDLLARIAVKEIIDLREQIAGSHKVINNKAYIIRQLKHPDEVSLLRKVYGKQFILISAYGGEDDRRSRLIEGIKMSAPTTSKESEIKYMADKLIERDASEVGESLGQQLRDTFHLADVFIDGINAASMQEGVERFFNAFFGRLDIGPTKDEYAMYAAKSASLRSSDLSRQVGAAIFSCDGELITQGCNEVPKARGGTYWDGEIPDYRDTKIGYDPNDKHKREILRDAIERLRVCGYLSDQLLGVGSDAKIVAHLIAKKTTDAAGGALAESRLMDLTEFGRVVHAEMCAMCDAARLGRSVKGGRLYCTTFPCHNCTKHIIACGIVKVVYLEPYPKSRAKELHDHEIAIDSETDTTRVAFVPFMGVSPVRYRDIFQKGRRKSRDGHAEAWLAGQPKPMLDIEFPSYIQTTEPWAVGPLIGHAESARSDMAADVSESPP